MGAQLSLFTPTASTVALQSYIDIIPDVQYSSTITSSRFLKTVKSLDSNGFVIVKILIKSEKLNLSYANALADLDAQQQKLMHISGTVPFTKIIETERANYAIRPFIKSNLFDRLSTRPFLERIEKKWIAFQILHTLAECHSQGIIHGDLKTENVLITSWNWCLIADFENFKPIVLPEDSSQFSFYFDTSKRNTCYLAPERFQSAQTMPALTQEMDLFSVGCVLAELYLDGSPIFTLPQLFKYKRGEYEPNLNGIDDVHVRDLILDLIALDPAKRVKLRQLLANYRVHLFPAEFYDFYYSKIEELSNYKTPVSKTKKDRFQECDYRIDSIYDNFKQFAEVLQYKPDKESGTAPPLSASPIPIVLSLPGLENYSPKSTAQAELNQQALIVLSMILASVRNTTHSSFRIKSCDLIIVLAEKLHDEAKLDRCLPYLMYLLEDPCCDVKVAALRSITQILYMCDSISVINISIWQEYILPKLSVFNNSISQSKESANFLKLQFAKYLPFLMSQSLKFYNFSKILQNDNRMLIKSFNMAHLVREFENFTLNLLTDPNANVKISLLQNITELCQFFGKDKTNDLILSHLITYLNDKNPHLRYSFIESILPLSMFTGIASLEQYILPLLVQTINNPDEMVVFKILKTFNQLVNLGMLKKHYIWDLVKIVIKLILHPNEWIRKTTLILIITICERVSSADLYCILYPIIRPFFQYDVTVFTYDSLYPCLTRSLSRSVYSLAINWAQTSTLESSLFWQRQSNNNADSFGNSGMSFMVKTKTNLRFSDNIISVNNNEIPVSADDRLWFIKLTNSGLSDSEFWKLATLRDHIYRISKLNFKNVPLKLDANIEIQKIGVLPKTLFFDISYKSEEENASRLTQSPPPPAISISQHDTASSITLAKNSITPPFTPPQALILGKMTKAAPSIHEDRGNAFAIGRDSTNDSASVMTEHSQTTFDNNGNTKLIQEIGAMDKIITKIQHNYKGKNPYILRFLSSFKFEPQLQDYIEFGPQINVDLNSDSKSWTPKGVLVAHFTEHKASCNCIAVAADHHYFITGDNDGVLKIWDALRLERNVTDNASLSVNLNSSIRAISFIGNRDCFAVALKNGFIKIFRIGFEKNGKNRFNKLHLIRDYKLNDEFVLQLEHLDELLIMTTSSARIIGIDVRLMKEVFVLQNDLSHGLPVSFVLDNKKKSWILVSTTNGVLDLWDIRFELHLRSTFINKKVKLKQFSNDFKKFSSKRNRNVMMITNDDEISIFDISKLSSAKQQAQLNPLEDFSPVNQIEFIQVAKNHYMVSSTSSNDLIYWNLKNLVDSKFLIEKQDKILEFNEFQQNEVLKYTFNASEVTNMTKKRNKFAVEIDPTDLINDIKFISKPYEMVITIDRSGCVNVYR